MALNQFDVFPKPGRRSAAVPFVVAVQSNQFRRNAYAIVVPLLLTSQFGRELDSAPLVTVAGQTLIFDPLQITSVPTRALGLPAASLADQEERLGRALDIVFSRAWL